jgi:hypothetical protein
MPRAPEPPVRVTPRRARGAIVVRVALGGRRVDLSLDQAGRLAGELTAAVRLAQHHADGAAGQDAAGPSRLRRSR